MSDGGEARGLLLGLFAAACGGKGWHWEADELKVDVTEGMEPCMGVLLHWGVDTGASKAVTSFPSSCVVVGQEQHAMPQPFPCLYSNNHTLSHTHTPSLTRRTQPQTPLQGRRRNRSLHALLRPPKTTTMCPDHPAACRRIPWCRPPPPGGPAKWRVVGAVQR